MCIALDQGHAVVCIATESHRRLLERRVVDRGIDVFAAQAKGQIACLDAVRTLAKISRGDSIDVVRFAEVVGAVVDGLSSRYSRVWIFGELVALMCMKGHHEGAIELEKLWSSFTAARPSICLHCAYPAHAFTPQNRAAFLRICDARCRILHSDSSLAIEQAAG
jgi:hypothetical protein